MSSGQPGPQSGPQEAAESGQRHATWPELFFDLVLAVGVNQLGTNLIDDPTPRGLAGYLLLFVPVWWLWMGVSYFVSQFDVGGRDTQAILLGAMAGVLALIAAMKGGPFAHPLGLPVAYLCLRVGLVVLYLVYRRRYPESRGLYNRYAVGWSCGAALWALSLLLPDHRRWILWSAALLLEIATPLVAHVSAPRAPRHISHMPERFGLFTLIVLGETVLAVVQSTGGTHWDAPAVVLCAIAFVVAASLWFVYFDDLDESVISSALTGGRRDLVLSYVFGYAHLFVFASIVAAGDGIRLLARAAAHGGAAAVHAEAGRLLFGGGIAIYLVACTVTHSIGSQPLPRRVVATRLVTAAAVLGVALAPIAPVVITLVVAALLLAMLLTIELVLTRPGPGFYENVPVGLDTEGEGYAGSGSAVGPGAPRVPAGPRDQT